MLVGGPPHSGKSVLIYSLSQALRARGVEHYALRASTAKETGSNEAVPERVRQIHIKGQWTPLWLQRIGQDIQRRHLPLLVDVGGRPTPSRPGCLASAPTPCCDARRRLAGRWAGGWPPATACLCWPT